MQTLKHTATTHQPPGSPSCQLPGPRTMHHAWGCGGRSPLPTGPLPSPTCRQHTGNTKHSKPVSRWYYGYCRLLFTIAQWFPTSGDTVPGRGRGGGAHLASLETFFVVTLAERSATSWVCGSYGCCLASYLAKDNCSPRPHLKLSGPKCQ